MIRTAEAVIDEHGTVRLLEPVEVAGARRALVTILDEEPTLLAHETPILSERSLAEDWDRPEEDVAWSHLHISDALDHLRYWSSTALPGVLRGCHR